MKSAGIVCVIALSLIMMACPVRARNLHPELDGYSGIRTNRNSVYEIKKDTIYSGSNIYPISKNYILFNYNGKWEYFDRARIDTNELFIWSGGQLKSMSTNTLHYYYKNQWWHYDLNKVDSNQGFILQHGDLRILNDGWYHQAGVWKSIADYSSDTTGSQYRYNVSVPYGLFFYSAWNDTNKDNFKEDSELRGLNKPVYNIAKETFHVAVNIPNITGTIVFTSWKGDSLIGCSAYNVKNYSPGWYNYMGTGDSPTKKMDFVDRIELDVRKNGPGVYKIQVYVTDKSFMKLERKVRIIYQP